MAAVLLSTLSIAQSGINWVEVLQDIERSSYLNTVPGSTLERDVYSLIDFFNKTCTEAQADAVDAALDVLNNLARQHQQQLEAAGDPRQGHSAVADLSPGAVQWLERSDGSERAVRAG